MLQYYVNIRKAIRMYQMGQQDGEELVVIIDARVVSQREARRSKRWCWVKVSFFLLLDFGFLGRDCDGF